MSPRIIQIAQTKDTLDFHVSARLYGEKIDGRIQLIPPRLIFQSYKYCQDTFGGHLQAVEKQELNLGFKNRTSVAPGVILPYLPVQTASDDRPLDISPNEEDMDNAIFRRITTRQPTKKFEVEEPPVLVSCGLTLIHFRQDLQEILTMQKEPIHKWNLWIQHPLMLLLLSRDQTQRCVYQKVITDRT